MGAIDLNRVCLWFKADIDPENFKEHARRESTRIFSRVIVEIVASSFLFIFVGAQIGLVWLSLLLVAESLEAWACRRLTYNPRRLRYFMLANALTVGLFWTLDAILLWNSDQPIAYIAAVMSLLSVALYGAIGSYHSRISFLLLVVPQLVTLVALLSSYAWTHTSPLIATVATLATVGTCGTVLANYFSLYRTHQALNASYRALTDANRRLEDLATEAEQANRAKTDFLATMSHEIRTPLNGVLGMAQAMQLDALSPAQLSRLKTLAGSGEALRSILNDMLDIAKIEAGKLEIETVDFDLADFLQSATAAFQTVAGEKGLDFQLILSPTAHGLFSGDPTRLRQILHNLISNAIKFTERGSVSVQVDWRDGQLSMDVTDTGLGMEPHHLDGIFERYAQGPLSTTRRFGGTGLGLAICRQLAQMMGGQISVASTPGLGTAFHVAIPLMHAESRPVGAPGQLGPHNSSEWQHLRLLVAEDNAINQLVVGALLQPFGIEPDFVSNGEQAVAAWETGRFDLILMDIQMPIMDGPTASARIRALERATGRAPTPIFALTGYAMAHQLSAFTAAGMDGHIPKPINISSLLAAIQSVAPLSDGV